MKKHYCVCGGQFLLDEYNIFVCVSCGERWGKEQIGAVEQ